ncbi:putative Clr5 domain-containing protein [Seiridium unicorne]|uniref:Clr5 domain-containing protein n=1 Tax=Seiridium unicorne TaxID=138068 RepID=A0ABR2UTJ1_9PEZI
MENSVSDLLDGLKSSRRLGIAQSFMVGGVLEVAEDLHPLNSYNEEFWQRMLGHPVVPVIVQGYPISPRLEQGSGLEFLFDVLLDTASAQKAHAVADCVHHGRYKTRSAVVDWTDGMYYWYKAGSSKNPAYLNENSGSHAVGNSKYGARVEADRSGRNHVVCSHAEQLIHGQPRFDDSTWENALSTSESITSSSLKSGAYSISSSSEVARIRNGEYPISEFLKSVCCRSIAEFQNRGNEEASEKPSDQLSTKATRGEGSSYEVTGNSSGKNSSRKRQRKDSKSSGEDDDERDSRDAIGPKTQKLDGTSKPENLACPFWKFDPNKHPKCLKSRLTSISYVKQHMRRSHTPKYYCQRCYLTFSTERDRNGHMETFCELCPLAITHAVWSPQSMELQKKGRGTGREQWCKMWEILFPDHTPPPSIYVDLDQSDDFCMLREFSRRCGPRIVQQELDAQRLLPGAWVANKEVLRAIGSALDMIFENYRQSGLASPSDDRHSVPSRSQNRSSDARCSQPYTQRRSTIDSGILAASPSSSSLRIQGNVSRDDFVANGNRKRNDYMEIGEFSGPETSGQADAFQPNQAASLRDIEGAAGPTTHDQAARWEPSITNYHENSVQPTLADGPRIQNFWENDIFPMNPSLIAHATNGPAPSGVDQEELYSYQDFNFNPDDFEFSSENFSFDLSFDGE